MIWKGQNIRHIFIKFIHFFYNCSIDNQIKRRDKNSRKDLKLINQINNGSLTFPHKNRFAENKSIVMTENK